MYDIVFVISFKSLCYCKPNNEDKIKKKNYKSIKMYNTKNVISQSVVKIKYKI